MATPPVFQDKGDTKDSTMTITKIPFKKNFEHLVIVPGTAASGMAHDIAKHIGVNVADVEIKRFSDGEIFCRYKENVRGKDVFIIQSCAGIFSTLL